MEAWSTSQTKSLSFMVPNFSNWMISLAGSEEAEEDHLNILIVDSSVFYNIVKIFIQNNSIIGNSIS